MYVNNFVLSFFFVFVFFIQNILFWRNFRIWVLVVEFGVLHYKRSPGLTNTCNTLITKIKLKCLLQKTYVKYNAGRLIVIYKIMGDGYQGYIGTMTYTNMV